MKKTALFRPDLRIKNVFTKYLTMFVFTSIKTFYFGVLPAGLRQYVRSTLRYSLSRLTYKYSVHELCSSLESPLSSDINLHDDEVMGEDLVPGSNGTWQVCRWGSMTVSAASIEHSAPCLGYVLNEDPLPGRLQIERIQPILQQHASEFVERFQIRNPMSLLSSFKSGIPITLPDGTILSPQSFLDPPKNGRKIVILGDTHNPSNITELALDADLLIHEATNAFLLEDRESTTFVEVQERCISHGHSTPGMAGEFARRVRARQLVLNHFSSRYKGDESDESQAIMEQIRQLAVREFVSDNVIVASDFLCVPVVRQRRPD